MNIFLNNLKIQLSNIDVSKLETFKKLVLNSKGTILILGNGGSNAIASHIAEDYTKVLEILSFWEDKHFKEIKIKNQ
jgi:phosphoheptose isomerase